VAYHLTHPHTGQEIAVDADSVPVYLSQGWETKQGARKASKKGGTTPRTTTKNEEEA
jgi:hypothetical protein